MLRHIVNTVSPKFLSFPSAYPSTPLASIDSFIPVFANLNLAESRRWRRMRGSSARIGRPRKSRSTRAKEWWVDKHTRHFGYDQNLTLESKDFVQDFLREEYNQGAGVRESPLKDAPWEAQPWIEDRGTRRCGVLALKIGVVPQWLKDGQRISCTMFQVLDCHVINYTSPEEWDQQFSYHKYKRIAKVPLQKLQDKRGKFGVQTVGALSCDPQRFSKEYTGLFEKAGVLPKRRLTRFFVTPNAAIKPGTELTARHFRVGDHVIAEARTIGHGFEGVMIRWGFAGGPATHGCTKFHRKPGNIGFGISKARVHRGKKLPGHMGNEWRLAFNLKILRINTKYNVIYVHGSTPGPPHAIVRIFDSTHFDQESRVSATSHPPLPTFVEGSTPSLQEPDANGDIFDETLFDFAHPSISFAAKT